MQAGLGFESLDEKNGGAAAVDLHNDHSLVKDSAHKLCAFFSEDRPAQLSKLLLKLLQVAKSPEYMRLAKIAPGLLFVAHMSVLGEKQIFNDDDSFNNAVALLEQLAGSAFSSSFRYAALKAFVGRLKSFLEICEEHHKNSINKALPFFINKISELDFSDAKNLVTKLCETLSGKKFRGRQKKHSQLRDALLLLNPDFIKRKKVLSQGVNGIKKPCTQKDFFNMVQWLDYSSLCSLRAYETISDSSTAAADEDLAAAAAIPPANAGSFTAVATAAPADSSNVDSTAVTTEVAYSAVATSSAAVAVAHNAADDSDEKADAAAVEEDDTDVLDGGVAVAAAPPPSPSDDSVADTAEVVSSTAAAAVAAPVSKPKGGRKSGGVADLVRSLSTSGHSLFGNKPPVRRKSSAQDHAFVDTNTTISTPAQDVLQTMAAAAKAAAGQVGKTAQGLFKKPSPPSRGSSKQSNEPGASS